MTNSDTSGKLAGQWFAESRAIQPDPGKSPERPALRVRPGWTLIAVGLALAARPSPVPAATSAPCASSSQPQRPDTNPGSLTHWPTCT